MSAKYIGYFAITLALLASGRATVSASEIYCKTVSGAVEGFGQSYTRFTAERARDEAVETERARRREMGREIVKVETYDTTCEAVYPLGFEEWSCVAKADVCVAR